MRWERIGGENAKGRGREETRAFAPRVGKDRVTGCVCLCLEQPTERGREEEREERGREERGREAMVGFVQSPLVRHSTKSVTAAAISHDAAVSVQSRPLYCTQVLIHRDDVTPHQLKEYVQEIVTDQVGRTTVLFADEAERHRRRVFLDAGFVPEDGTRLVYLGNDESGEEDDEERLRDCDHVSIRVASMNDSISFYSLLGYEPFHKFRTGSMRAAWLKAKDTNGGRGRRQLIELIEVPQDLCAAPLKLWFDQPPYPRGFYHVSLDVTRFCTSLQAYLTRVQNLSAEKFKRKLSVLFGPKDKMMYNLIVDVAFIRDPDGTVIELIRRQKILDIDMQPDWE